MKNFIPSCRMLMLPPKKRIHSLKAIVLLGTSMMIGCQTIRTEVFIPAEPSAVWGIISDAPSYEQWNPVHVRVEGEFRTGSRVKIHLKDPKGKVSVFSANVRAVEKERLLNQGGGTPGFFTFSHTFLLEPVEGGTKLTQMEEFKGIGVLFVNMDWVYDSYSLVNQVIKERALRSADRR